MLGCTICHWVLFVFSLCLVGFFPMIYNLLLAAWAYSCYLTLREREVVVYFIFMTAAIVIAIARFFRGNEGSWQSLAGLVDLGVYMLLLYISVKYYYYFRISGGLHGLAEGSKQARKYRVSLSDVATPKFSLPDTASNKDAEAPLLDKQV